MAKPARQRELVHSRAIWNFHPKFKDAGLHFYYGNDDEHHQPATCEGGDILVIGNGAVMIGMGERTTPQGIGMLVRGYFSDPRNQVNKVIVVELPKTRAFMHLDTAMTMIDRDAFSVYPFLPPELKSYTLTKKDDGGAYEIHENDVAVPRAWPRPSASTKIRALKTPIDEMGAAREQWDDGNNFLAVAPGVIFGYERNTTTNTFLRKNGHRDRHDRRVRARSRTRRPALHELPHRARRRVLTADRRPSRPTWRPPCRSTCATATSSRRSTSPRKELQFLLDLSRDLKRAKYAGTEVQRMKGKNVALIFEKTSTRTRCAFEVGAYDQGARVTYLDPNSSQIGHKESAADTARVLSRFYDAIEFRGSAQATVETLAEYSDVPVYNGLTDEWHPTQMLADFLTMIEHGRGKPVEEIAYAYMGDARSNMGHSLLRHGRDHGRRRAHRGAQGAVAEQGDPEDRQGARRAVRRAAHPHRGRRRRRSRASTTSTPTCGSRWASPRRSGTSGSSCSRRTRSTRRRSRRPATRT